jgi:hypothetical protein
MFSFKLCLTVYVEPAGLFAGAAIPTPVELRQTGRYKISMEVASGVDSGKKGSSQHIYALRSPIAVPIIPVGRIPPFHPRIARVHSV